MHLAHGMLLYRTFSNDPSLYHSQALDVLCAPDLDGSDARLDYILGSGDLSPSVCISRSWNTFVAKDVLDF